jgi:hypothetical protein
LFLFSTYFIGHEDKEEDDTSRRSSESSSNADPVVFAIAKLHIGVRSRNQSPEEENEDGRSHLNGPENQQLHVGNHLDLERRLEHTPDTECLGKQSAKKIINKLKISFVLFVSNK